MNNTILNPDEDGIGEIGVRSRNVFMGYHKDQAKTEESFQVNCKIILRLNMNTIYAINIFYIS